MSKKSLSLLVLLTLTFPAGSALAQDVTAAWFETTDLTDNETHRGVMYFAQGMLRLDPDRKGELNASVIFRGDRQHMIVLDHTRKTYFILDDKVIGRVGGQLDNMMAQMEAHLAQLPEDQQEMARRMMEEQMPQAPAAQQARKIPTRVEARQETKEINGYSCRLFELYRAKEKVSAIWATRDVDYRHLASVFQEVNRFSQRVRESARFADFETGVDFLGFEGLEGFPILVETYENGALAQKTSFRKVAPTAKAVSFETEAGYKPQAPGGRD